MMTQEEIKKATLAALTEIAPEISVDEIVSDVNFRDQFDFDSMDFLNFTLALEARLKIKIPQADYPKLSNLDGCIAYFSK